ncbi:hypothetical protein ABIB94_007097 [Bradyrhizobium sp. JR7.2]|uniref:hypothetical protein n=1 Tax=Bradyrhizobium sp. JR7.2 TaxID=3156375 RepID=UPI00339306A6
MADRIKLPKMAPGQRYGRLTAIEFSGRDHAGKILWKFRCDCGNDVTARSASVRYRRSSSCGCLQREAATKHAMHKTPEYKSWSQMLERCRNKNHHAYKDYGGRGISVCDRWFKFENFFADMGKRPEGHSIDRHPNNGGNYEPENCRWATPKEQIDNRRPVTLHKRMSKNNTSGVQGVKRHCGKWQANITFQGKRYHLGTFTKIEDAAAVVHEARERFAIMASSSA